MNLRTLLVGSITALAAAVSADAASITIGNIDLLPNTPGQTFEVYVTGGDMVQGLNFFAQVADGGPTSGGVIDGPNITSVSIIAPGTIFATNNVGQNSLGGELGHGDFTVDEFYSASTVTTAGTVAAEGLLAIVTINTTGFFAGETFEFRIGNTVAGDTDFAGVPVEITNGTLNVVPEPTALALIGLPAAALLRRRRSI